MSLSQDEILRYSRHLIMPEVGVEGQEKLKAAKVLLIGTGGLFGHVIRIAPQMLMSEDEVTDGLDRLGRACRRIA